MTEFPIHGKYRNCEEDYGYAVSTGPLVWDRHKDQLAKKPSKSSYPLIWAEAASANENFQFRADKRKVNLPPYIDRAAIHKRLQKIFPEGIPQRNYCVREAAASTVFTMLYVGAIEASGEWAVPKQIVRRIRRPQCRMTLPEPLTQATP